MVQVLRTSLIKGKKARVFSPVIFGRSYTVITLILGVAISALACAFSSEEGATGADQESVRGLIRAVESRSLLALDSLDLTDEAGVTWHFEAERKTFTSFTPSHLSEHMLQGLRLTVVFHMEGEWLVLDDVTD